MVPVHNDADAGGFLAPVIANWGVLAGVDKTGRGCMKLISYQSGRSNGIGLVANGGLLGLDAGDARFPGTLADLIEAGEQRIRAAGDIIREYGSAVDTNDVIRLPPCLPGKIICIGLNYADHAAESDLPIPEFPVLFSRFSSSVIADGAAIRRPKVSTALDFEGELAVVIGKAGRYIPESGALDHVAGYSIFNDATVRDYQLRTSQWTIGKNFDATGPFGPYLVTPDELPLGASGLAIETRLNGQVVQKSSTDQLIFGVAKLIAAVSEAMTLQPCDVIITGTPAGVGHVRKPQLHMRAGDLVEVEIEQIGLLSNPIADEDI